MPHDATMPDQPATLEERVAVLEQAKLLAELEAATLAVTVAQQEMQLAQHRDCIGGLIAMNPGASLPILAMAVSAIGSSLAVASPAAFLALEESVRKFVAQHVDDTVREQAKDVLGILAAWSELRPIVEHSGRRPARPAAPPGFRPRVVQ